MIRQVCHCSPKGRGSQNLLLDRKGRATPASKRGIFPRWQGPWLDRGHPCPQVTHENLSGAAEQRLIESGRGPNHRRIQSPLRGSEMAVTVYQRLADSPWAGALAAAPQLDC